MCKFEPPARDHLLEFGKRVAGLEADVIRSGARTHAHGVTGGLPAAIHAELRLTKRGVRARLRQASVELVATSSERLDLKPPSRASAHLNRRFARLKTGPCPRVASLNEASELCSHRGTGQQMSLTCVAHFDCVDGHAGVSIGRRTTRSDLRNGPDDSVPPCSHSARISRHRLGRRLRDDTKDTTSNETHRPWRGIRLCALPMG